MPKGDSKGSLHASLVARGKRLTDELRKLANEVVDSEFGPDGEVVSLTREQKLAAMIWKQALGWTEKFRDPDTGNLEERPHPPVAWCQQFLFERIEGKAPIATQETESGIKATDKVRELVRDRLNAVAAGKSTPPLHRPSNG